MSNLATALTRIFTPTALRLIIVAGIPGCRTRTTAGDHPHGVPILAEASATLSCYLRAERDLGRLLSDADADALAFTLVGTGHLLFAGELGGLPDTDAVEEIVESIIVGAQPGIRP